MPFACLKLTVGHVAQAELSDQALPLELASVCKLFLDGALVALHAADAQVDHVERIDLEVPEVVVTARVRSAGVSAESDDASAPRTAPTLVT